MRLDNMPVTASHFKPDLWKLFFKKVIIGTQIIVWELEMNDVEKRNIAVARELVELKKIVSAFNHVVRDAQLLADECKASADRCKEIISSEALDQAIDNLDYLTQRGDYLYLRAIDEHGAYLHSNGMKPIEVQRRVDSVMGKFDALVADFKRLRV